MSRRKTTRGTNRMSIRHSDAAPRGGTQSASGGGRPAVSLPPSAPLPVPPAGARRPLAPEPVRVNRGRPDPNPLRLMAGVVGLASAAALTSAMLPSITPQAAAQDPSAVSNTVPQQPVQHVTKYVTLQPGQTAPPQSTVIVRPQPTPKVVTKVVTRTRQSGR